MTALTSPGFRSVGFRDIGSPAGALQPVAGAIAWYRCDKGSGQILYDYSGNGNHGTLGSTAGVDTNDPTWDEKGLVFGGDDWCTIQIPPNITTGSVSVIVAPSNFADNQYLIDSRSASGTVYGFIFLALTSGIIRTPNTAIPYLNQNQITPQSVSAPVNQWSMITAAGVDFSQMGGAISIGKKNYSTPSNLFIGGIAGVIIHPYTISPPQVAQQYAYEKYRLNPKGAILP